MILESAEFGRGARDASVARAAWIRPAGRLTQVLALWEVRRTHSARQGRVPEKKRPRLAPVPPAHSERFGPLEGPAMRADINVSRRLSTAPAGPLAVALAMLCLMGCASGPTEYQRGTFTPPAPAAVRPGVGAPVQGQPGMQPRTTPRGTDKRVLPPTREPGIWAADKPHRVGLPDANPNWPNPPAILETPLPYPAVGDPEDNPYYARKCSWLATEYGAFVVGDPAAMPPPVKRCLAARLFAACMKSIDEASAHLKTEATFAAHINATRATADGFVKDACVGVPDAPEADAFLRGAQLHFRRSIK